MAEEFKLPCAWHNERARQVLDSAFDNDEPVFVLRAKDMHSMNVLNHYFHHVANGPTNLEFMEQVRDLLGEFGVWRLRHPDQIKYPD